MVQSILTTVFCLVLAALVSSQDIIAPSCTEPYYAWADNSLRQDACTMAAYAIAACNGGVANISALATNMSVYTGPATPQEGDDPCKCNTVSYSLISACAGCQGSEWLPYTTFTANCSSAFTNFTRGDFAPNVDIPPASAFPAWAYDRLDANSFNNATAYAIFLRNTTEFTHDGASNTHGTASEPSTSNTVSHSKSHAGAIAGGVVGGVVGLALIAGSAAFFIIRRRRRARTAISEKQHMGDIHGPMSPTTMEPRSPRRYYNPSDPSTFPDAMFNNRNVNGSSVAMSSPAPGSTTNATRNGHHTMPSWGSSEIGSTDKAHHYPGLPEL